MPDMPGEELKNVMLTCHQCGWSYSSRKTECPMCGSKIKIKEKELVGYLQEYIDRQGVYAGKKECEGFIKKFKKQRKRLPTMDELWKASKDYVKMQKMSDEELKKEQAKRKSDEEIHRMQEKLKQKRIEELKKKRSNKGQPEQPISTPKKPVMASASQISTKKSSGSISAASIPSKTKFLNKEQRLANLRAKKKLMASQSKEDIIANAKKELIQEEKKVVISDGYLICPQCGTKNPPGSKFCLEDGTRLD